MTVGYFEFLFFDQINQKDLNEIEHGKNEMEHGKNEIRKCKFCNSTISLHLFVSGTSISVFSPKKTVYLGMISLLNPIRSWQASSLELARFGQIG